MTATHSRRRSMIARPALAVAVASIVAGVTSPAARATLLYATSGTTLSRFDSTSLGVVTTVPLSGLQAGESLVDIDVRPATGELYGVGSSSRLYTINPLTGAVTQIGLAGAFTLNGTA